MSLVPDPNAPNVPYKEYIEIIKSHDTSAIDDPIQAFKDGIDNLTALKGSIQNAKIKNSKFNKYFIDRFIASRVNPDELMIPESTDVTKTIINKETVKKFTKENDNIIETLLSLQTKLEEEDAKFESSTLTVERDTKVASTNTILNISKNIIEISLIFARNSRLAGPLLGLIDSAPAISHLTAEAINILGNVPSIATEMSPGQIETFTTLHTLLTSHNFCVQMGTSVVSLIGTVTSTLAVIIQMNINLKVEKRLKMLETRVDCLENKVKIITELIENLYVKELLDNLLNSLNTFLPQYLKYMTLIIIKLQSQHGTEETSKQIEDIYTDRKELVNKIKNLQKSKDIYLNALSKLAKIEVQCIGNIAEVSKLEEAVWEVAKNGLVSTCKGALGRLSSLYTKIKTEGVREMAKETLTSAFTSVTSAAKSTAKTVCDTPAVIIQKIEKTTFADIKMSVIDFFVGTDRELTDDEAGYIVKQMLFEAFIEESEKIAKIMTDDSAKETGFEGGYVKNNDKKYIKYNNRKYIVRKNQDSKKKFIKVKDSILYLSEIKGKYKYIIK